MAVSKTCWGIDIGQCALKAIKIRQSGDRVEILACDVIEHDQILSEPNADVPALIRSAIETFTSRNDVAGDAVAIAVPGNQTFARFTKLPPVEPKKVPDIVRFEARQQIPFDIDEVDWDYQTFSSPDSPDVEVGIFAMKRELVRRHLAPLTSVRINPSVVQTAPLALYNFINYDGLATGGGTALVDIGAENTDLIVTDGLSVWSRNIPIGGNNFTEALVKNFKLSFSKAENLKRTAASSKYARQIFQAMRPVFADLVAEIQRSIGFYTSTHRDVSINKVLGMGNAFLLPGLQKYLQQNLQMDVQRPDGFARATLTGGVDTKTFQDNILTLGVAYGLALQGLGLSVIKSNLLPVELGRATIWRRKRPFFAAAAACLVLAAGALWVRGVMDRSAMAQGFGGEDENVSVTDPEAERIFNRDLDENLPPRVYAGKWAATAANFQGRLGALEAEGPRKLKHIEDVTKLVSNSELWPKIIAAIHGALPPVQPELAQATGPIEFAAAAKKVARGQRQQIVIESLQAQYTDDVYAALEAAKAGGKSSGFAGGMTKGGKSSSPTAAAGKAGFVITLNIRTPNSQAVSFISNTLVENLRTLAYLGDNAATLGFYFDKVDIATHAFMGASGQGSSRRSSSYGSGGGGIDAGKSGSGGGWPGPARSTARSSFSLADAGPEIPDPVTGEEMAQDSLCEVRFAVVFGEKPAEDTAGEQGASK